MRISLPSTSNISHPSKEKTHGFNQAFLRDSNILDFLWPITKNNVLGIHQKLNGTLPTDL